MNRFCFIPRGDLLCWKFIELLKFQITNPKKTNKITITEIQNPKQKINRSRGASACAARLSGLEFVIYL